MKKHLLTISILLVLSCNFVTNERVEVSIPTINQETENVWRVIQDIKFYDEDDYDITLPNGAVIDSLIDKSRKGKLLNMHYTLLKDFMKNEIYSESDYQKGFVKVERVKPLLNRMIDQISETDRNWNFKIFEKYRVILTLYGPGGNYDPDEGTITFYTTVDGEFKQYDNPANILIHEITHLGIEESLIRRFNVPQELKERIVDTFVYLNFHEILPEYEIHPVGDERIDSHLRTIEDLSDLADVVERFMKQD